ncbi:NPH1 [Symbiodinium microadriaticum]|nr:NPH1 [Symbiodinium microadriaticum]
MLSINYAPAVPGLLLIACSIHLAASSRGEASLSDSDAVKGPEADVPKHCEEAVQHSHSASETIKALQACIEDLERHSSQSKAAHSQAKQTSQTYANDVNMLGSFLQSLKATLNKTYEKHKLQYTSLREDHQQVVSGLIQKLATLEALEGKERAHQHARVSRTSHGNSNRKLHRMPQTKSSLHQARQTSVKKSKKLEEALRKVAERKQRGLAAQHGEHAQHSQSLRKAPSLLQLSAQNGEDPPRNEGDWSQDQVLMLFRRSDGLGIGVVGIGVVGIGVAVVWVHVSFLYGVDALSVESDDISISEMSSLADLFWKPLTGIGLEVLHQSLGHGGEKRGQIHLVSGEHFASVMSNIDFSKSFTVSMAIHCNAVEAGRQVPADKFLQIVDRLFLVVCCSWHILTVDEALCLGRRSLFGRIGFFLKIMHRTDSLLQYLISDSDLTLRLGGAHHRGHISPTVREVQLPACIPAAAGGWGGGFLIAYCFAWYIAAGEGHFPNPFEDSFRWSAGEELREVARKKALGLSFAREVLAPLELTEELLRKDVLQRSQPEEW